MCNIEKYILCVLRVALMFETPANIVYMFRSTVNLYNVVKTLVICKSSKVAFIDHFASGSLNIVLMQMVWIYKHVGIACVGCEPAEDGIVLG